MIEPIDPIRPVSRRLKKDYKELLKLDKEDEGLAKSILEILSERRHNLHDKMMKLLSKDAEVFHDTVKDFHEGKKDINQIESQIRRFFKARKALIKAMKEIIGG